MIILNFDKFSQNHDIVILDFKNSDDEQSKIARIGGRLALSLVANGKLSYDSDVFRGLVAEVSIKQESSSRLVVQRLVNVRLAGVESQIHHAKMESSRLIGRRFVGYFDSVDRLDKRICVRSESSKPLYGTLGFGFENLHFVQYGNKIQQDTAKILGFGREFLSEYMVKVYQNFAFGRETARQVLGYFFGTSNVANLVLLGLCVKRETARLPKNQRGIVEEIPFEPPFVVLNFDCEWQKANTLHFGVCCKPVVDNGVIFVLNEVSLTRLDGRNIDMFSFQVAIDNNSYCWSFSADIPMAEFGKVDIFNEPQINVELVVNGHHWRFILDGLEHSHAFNDSRLLIKGKSRSILLASPYSSHRGFRFDNMTSRQIAESELNRNGVPSGFSLDWQVGDLVGDIGWRVPVYSYTGRTPINSLIWIADSFGGFINTHPYSDVVQVKANYPTPSWEWHEAEISLQDNRIVTLSQSRVQKPKYNGVLVAGEREGSVMGLIKRRGTIGGFQPPMLSHDLITEQSVAIARGKAELSNTGDMGNVALAMPFYNDLPLLTPSTLLGVQDWFGMVRGIAIHGKVGNRGEIVIEQSLDIERHFDKNN